MQISVRVGWVVGVVEGGRRDYCLQVKNKITHLSQARQIDRSKTNLPLNPPPSKKP